MVENQEQQIRYLRMKLVESNDIYIKNIILKQIEELVDPEEFQNIKQQALLVE